MHWYYLLTNGYFWVKKASAIFFSETTVRSWFLDFEKNPEMFTVYINFGNMNSNL